MPTVKINITTGIEFSPTDGLNSSVKLHNFTVGSDGSLYKMPVLKNLQNVQHEVIDADNVWPYRILDIKKFQTSSIELPPSIPAPIPGYNFHAESLFRRFVYLTQASYGVVNVNYNGERVLNSEMMSPDIYGGFEHGVFNFIPSTPGEPIDIDLSSLHSEILVDFNSQFNAEGQPVEELRCVFPMQHMFQSRTASGYDIQTDPRNVINCTMDPSAGGPDITPLSIFDVPGSERTINDLARGCVSIGNRMFFYSGFNGKIFVSAPNDFTLLAKDEVDDDAFVINPTEDIQSLIDFNGNIISFTPSGMDRWVLSPDDTKILVRDPTFHFDHRVRFGGSYVKANRDLYYYTDDFHVYRLNANLTVDLIFNGILPVYPPLQNYLIRDETLPMSYFEMVGNRFVSVGPWLYNLESSTWSTYSYDGWKNPYIPEIPNWIWESDTAKSVIAASQDDVICTYTTICRPLNYFEMQQLDPNLEPNLNEGEYQWGEVAFFTTRTLQDERTFSLDGVEVYVESGILQTNSKMWMKVLRGSEEGDFVEGDESTYGIPAEYIPIDAAAIGEDQAAHSAKFIWRTNLKTDRFALQFISTDYRGLVIEGVMVNITNIEYSQKFIKNNQAKLEPKREE